MTHQLLVLRLALRLALSHASRNFFPKCHTGSGWILTIRRTWSVACAACLACLSFTTSTAFADPANATMSPSSASPSSPANPPESDLGIQAAPVSQSTGLWNRSSLLGDMVGLRPWLGQYGLSLQATEVSEYLYNLRGGLHTGGAYDGLTTVTLGLDTSKAFGLPGGTFNVSALQIHGSNLSTANLGTLNTASGIEAQGSTRLWELWYQQSFFKEKLTVKVGQQSLDQEFMVSQYAATFVNTMFGWPGLPSYDMPSGGPAYPLADLGVRLRATLTPSLSALVGVFDGAPLGNNPTNLSGTNFNTHNGALFIGEVQYAIDQPSEGQRVKPGAGALPGTYKIGAWYNNARFADQQFDSTGVSLAASPNGMPQTHNGDYSFYAVADQTIWRPDPGQPRSIGVFARIMGAPGNRNLVSVSANAGIVMKAPFKGRENDSVGLGLGYIKVGNHVHGLDLDNAAMNGGPYGVRTSETVLEATYQYQVAPWWIVQGDLQYTFDAGAGQNPIDPTRPLRNTFVAGVRTTLTF